MSGRPGPLRGLRVVEMAGIGPVPMCGMLLADLGADVVRIERDGDPGANIRVAQRFNILNRGKRRLVLDLKSDAGREAALAVICRADVLIEGFRPGVMERLGLGPGPCLAANPMLVFGRMTGFGQSGPLAQEPSHDLNILALTGVLDAIGPAGGPPTVPLNLIADFGGGALYLAFGVMAALWDVRQHGRGQCVDAAMLDGVASLASFLYGLSAAGAWLPERGSNPLDGGAHYYGVYATADGRHVSVAANEPKFYQRLIGLLGLDPAGLPAQRDRESWPEMRQRFAEAFRERSLAEWCERLEGAGVCFAPVLSFGEAAAHSQARARGVFVAVEGVEQPAPAPRFSRTPAAAPRSSGDPGDGATILADWGLSATELERLRQLGALTRPDS